MADFEGESSDSDQLDLPGDDLTKTEMFGEPAPSEENDAARPADEQEKTESEEDETEGKAKEKRGFLKLLSTADPYTVMLGLALLAILIAICCLLLELNTYDFDLKALDYKQP